MNLAMRVCPKCNESYVDDDLNFCLNDGELLLEMDTQDAPPTIIMDSARVTNDGNWGSGFNPGTGHQGQFNQPNQQIYQQPGSFPQGVMPTAGKDQTLPMVSIITGISSVFLSMCCFLGVLLGPVALITGFIGMNNANKNPSVYDGKNLAIIGMVAGVVGIGASFLMILISILSG